MCYLLMGRHLWDLVNGSRTQPEAPEDDAWNALPIEEQRAIEKEVRHWQCDVDEALSIIFNACDQSVRSYIRDLEHPAQMWRALTTNLNNAGSHSRQHISCRTGR